MRSQMCPYGKEVALRIYAWSDRHENSCAEMYTHSELSVVFNQRISGGGYRKNHLMCTPNWASSFYGCFDTKYAAEADHLCGKELA